MEILVGKLQQTFDVITKKQVNPGRPDNQPINRPTISDREMELIRNEIGSEQQKFIDHIDKITKFN